MKILITGGAGYLGSTIVSTLLEMGHYVTVYDNLMYNQLTLTEFCYKTNFEFVYGDVRDYKKLNKYIHKCDVIIPLAAIVGFPACEKDKQLATAVNYSQIKDIVDNMSPAQLLLFPNTNSGYGSRVDGMVTETNTLTPISHYGQTKCDAENYIKSFSNGIVFRLATVFGVSPRMRLDLLVNEFVYKALTDKYLVVFEREFIRNYIHIRDVANIFDFMIDNYDDHKGEIFNVGLSDTNINKQQLAEKIKEYIPDLTITYSDYYKDPDKRDYIVSNEKIEKTGWKPTYSLGNGIKELIMAYQIIINNDVSHFRNGFPLTYGQPI
jgi:nucleoside-diphosphate-sugar epimerase